MAAGDGEVKPRRVEGALVVALPAGLEGFAGGSFETQRHWKQTDEFATRMRRVREHVDSFEPSTYELVVEVS